MGSVMDIKKCPKCGKVALHTDYYYRTDEVYETCSCCGYHYQRTLNEDGYDEVSTPISALVIRECRRTWSDTLDAHDEYSYSDIATEDMKKALEIGLSNIPEFKSQKVDETTTISKWPAFKDSDGEYHGICYRYKIEGDNVVSFYTRYDEEEGGGFGTALIWKDGVGALYTLEKDMDEAELQTMIDEVRESGTGHVARVIDGELVVLAGTLDDLEDEEATA